MTEIRTVVPRGEGDLPAAITAPKGIEATRFPGIVFIDGSGPGDVDESGGWPEWIAGCGAVVLRHAKPGTRAPGDWRRQTIADRADDTLAAIELLRSWPGVEASRVGVMGISQGGWVSPVVGTTAPEKVAFLINVSGPGVGVRETERYRLRREPSMRGSTKRPSSGSSRRR